MSEDNAKLENWVAEYFCWLKPNESHVNLVGHVTGELNADEAAAVAAHVVQCEQCAAALAAFQEVAPDWQDDPAPLPSSTQSQSNNLWVWLRKHLGLSQLLLGAALSAAALLLVIRPGELEQNSASPLRPKGGFELLVAVDRQGQGFRFSPGSRLETGDRLGFFYSTSTDGYLAVLYGDSQGRLVRLFPAGRSASAAIPIGTEVRIPDGAVISEGQGCEWIIGLFSETAISFVESEDIVHQMYARRKQCTLADPEEPTITARVLEVMR